MAEQNRQSDDSIAMAAVGRQFTDLAIKLERLQADLKRVVEMYNELIVERDELKQQVSAASEAAKTEA